MRPQVNSCAVPKASLQAIWAGALGLSLVLGQSLPASAQALPEASDALPDVKQALPAQGPAPISFAELAQIVSPSVVNITTSTTMAAADQTMPMIPEGSPFEDFFRDFMDRNQGGPQQPRRGQALGSGFVVSEDGFIVTNNHVVANADEIEVEFFSGKTLPAEVVGTDPEIDIALLKVESDEDLPFVNLGDSDDARVGDWVMAMGNPLGQGFSVSAGIVSARNRALSGSYDDYIQTDAAINRGNSGGPLFNLEGEVIGVNTAILSPNGGSIGIGFAMASNVVEKSIEQLEKYGETRRGWLGVRIQNVTDDVAEALGLDEAKGALVTDVPEGPAAEGGIEAGDLIVSFDGTEVDDSSALVRKVADTEVGKTVEVVVLRDNERETLDVTLGKRDLSDEAIPASVSGSTPSERDVLGMTVSGLTPELREQLGLDEASEGLVVTGVADESEAYDKGLRAGDLIVEAGQQKIANPRDLEARISDAEEAGRKSILLLVRRNDEPRFVALSLDES